MKFIILFLCFFSLQLFAEDLITTDGKVYKDYSIHEFKSSYVVITYVNGFAKISYKKLPEELKNKYKTQIIIQQEYKKLTGLFGYYLGEKLDLNDKYILQKGHDGNYYRVKAKRKDFDVKELYVHLTEDNIIYKITTWSWGNGNLKVYKLKSTFPKLKIPDKLSFFSSKKNYILKQNNKELNCSIIVEAPKLEDAKKLIPIVSSHISCQLTLVDTQLEPKENQIFKKIKKKKDIMQKTTWFSHLYEDKHVYNEYKNNDKVFYSIIPYVGLHDNTQDVIFRVNAAYVGKDWIFFKKIQIMNEKGKDIFIDVGTKKINNVNKRATVSESSDNYIPEDDILKIRKSKTLRIKFHGKYNIEFQLSPEHVELFNNLIEVYYFLKEKK